MAASTEKAVQNYHTLALLTGAVLRYCRNPDSAGLEPINMLGTKMHKSSWNTTHHQVAGCIFLNYCSNHVEILSVTTRVEKEQSNKFCLCLR